MCRYPDMRRATYLGAGLVQGTRPGIRYDRDWASPPAPRSSLAWPCVRECRALVRAGGAQA